MLATIITITMLCVSIRIAYVGSTRILAGEMFLVLLLEISHMFHLSTSWSLSGQFWVILAPK